MGGMFSGPSTPLTPPKAPDITDDAVQAAAAETNRRRMLAAQGRASTLLTDPQEQRDAKPNRQRFLGGPY